MSRIRSLSLLTALLCFSFSALQSPAASGGDDVSLRNRIKIRKRVKMERGSGEQSEEMGNEKMELLARKRQGLIQDIKRFILEAQDSGQKAELNLRLGGLYLEDYYANLARAQRRFEEKQKAFEEQGKNGKIKAPKFDNSEAVVSLEKARVIYKDLVSRYPKHPRRDEMLYFLAMASLDRGKTQEGMSYFQRLSVEAPNSKYVNDSLIQLGDHYFENNQHTVAEGYYDKLIARKFRPLLPYATYKKAWCQYNQQHTEAALKLLKWVIQVETENEGESQIKIRNEALKDITLPFVDLRIVDDAVAYFRQFGGTTFRQGVTTMAGLYFELGQHKHAISMYETVLGMDQNHPKNPSYEVNIIESLMNAGNREAAVQRLFARLPNYLAESTWHELNAANPKVIAEAAELFENTARKYAFQIHAEAQKGKNKELYSVARSLYSKYLQFFPHTPHSPKVRFYLAEILYKQEDFTNAATQYWAVYKDPSAGSLRLDSIRYALNSLDRQLNQDRKKAGLAAISTKSTGKLKAKEDEDLQLKPYSTVENKFLEISTEYLTTFAKQKDAPDVAYSQAYLRYDHHELVPAYKAFWTLVQTYPKHETAITSAYLILDILNRRKDFPKLIAACKKFMKTPELTSKKKFSDEISDVLRHAELKRIQVVEEKGAFQQAADEYVEYTKAYGSQDENLFEKALYNASVNFTKADNLMAAVETQERFLRRFPKSNLTENLLLQVAATYESLALFDKAAFYFEKLATTYPNNKQAKNALRLAGLYYWGAGSAPKAESVMRHSLRAYPSDKKLVERDLLDLYESEGATAKMVKFYLEARSQRGVSFADYLSYTVKIGELQGAKSGGRMPPQFINEAMKVAQKNEKAIASTPKGAETLAKLMFWVTYQKDLGFRNMKLALPQAQLEANLQRKLKLIKELEKEYNQIAKIGSGEWGLAAIFRTADAYRHMARTILAAPVPGELTGEQLEIYRNELNKEMIVPFNEKALALAEACLDKAQELNLLSNWTPRCYSLAGELKNDRYPLVRTFFLPPMRTALMEPKEKASKVPMGDVKQYAYPFYSSLLFKGGDAERQVAASDIPSLYASESGNEGVSVVPNSLNYRLLADERQTILKSAFNSERPSNPKVDTSFAYLNLMRVLAPKKAIPMILEYLKKDPRNESLHNLLGLSFVEGGNLPAAKVTWLSMVARGAKNAAIWNNLGVVAFLEGNEAQAIEYFQEAVVMPAPREALSNLGFIALKYRNGFEAKKHFQKALEMQDNDASNQVGFAIAQLQNREWDSAKDSLIGLAKRFKNDPYARLSLGYFLMDVDKENNMAGRILKDFVDTQSVDNDMEFRKAMHESRSLAGSAGGGGSSGPQGDLPDIE